MVCSLDLGPDAVTPGVVLGRPGTEIRLDRADPIGSLRRAERALAGRDRLGWLAYEAGGAIEPRAGAGHGDGGWDAGGLIALDDPERYPVEADAGAREGLVQTAGAWAGPGFVLDPLDLEAGRERYVRAVGRVLGFIRAGDVYQVNLTHRLVTRLHGSPRALAAAVFETARPWHGAYFETVGTDGRRRAVVSASPELFLDFDPASGVVRTRPMKGTRPKGGDAAELHAAEKDRAELNMIVDLMRNDLGRVCRFGSVRVDEPRAIEDHGSVLQATATVSGRVLAGVGLAKVLEATLSPGSVTGTPKIRAMQIIGELEGGPRGPYCGCMGLIDKGGRARLNVGIRTALLTEIGTDVWELVFPVGAGIVADSDPEAEWRETLDKAGALMGVAGMTGAGRD